MHQVLSKRYDIIEALVDGPKTKPELDSQLAVSRSTIDRGIADLLEHEYVEKVNSAFQATETGRLAFQSYARCLDYLETVQKSTPVVNLLPKEVVSHEFLRGARIDVVNPQIPWKVLERSSEIIHSAESLRATAPIMFKEFLDSISKSLDRTELDAEIIIDDALYGQLGRPEREILHEFQQTPRHTLLTTGLPTSHAVWIAESGRGDYAGITAYQGGQVVGVIYNDSESAVEWGIEKYESVKRSSKLLQIA